MDMLKKTILGTLAAGTVTGVAMFITKIAQHFAIGDWASTGQPTGPAMAAAFAVVLIGVGGADLARFFVRAATRSRVR